MLVIKSVTVNRWGWEKVNRANARGWTRSVSISLCMCVFNFTTPLSYERRMYLSLARVFVYK